MLDPEKVAPSTVKLVVEAPPARAMPPPEASVSEPVVLPVPERAAPEATVIGEVSEPVRSSRPALTWVAPV